MSLILNALKRAKSGKSGKVAKFTTIFLLYVLPAVIVAVGLVSAVQWSGWFTENPVYRVSSGDDTVFLIYRSEVTMFGFLVFTVLVVAIFAVRVFSMNTGGERMRKEISESLKNEKNEMDARVAKLQALEGMESLEEKLDFLARSEAEAKRREQNLEDQGIQLGFLREELDEQNEALRAMAEALRERKQKLLQRLGRLRPAREPVVSPVQFLVLVSLVLAILLFGAGMVGGPPAFGLGFLPWAGLQFAAVWFSIYRSPDPLTAVLLRGYFTNEVRVGVRGLGFKFCWEQVLAKFPLGLQSAEVKEDYGTEDRIQVKLDWRVEWKNTRAGLVRAYEAGKEAPGGIRAFANSIVSSVIHEKTSDGIKGLMQEIASAVQRLFDVPLPATETRPAETVSERYGVADVTFVLKDINPPEEIRRAQEAEAVARRAKAAVGIYTDSGLSPQDAMLAVLASMGLATRLDPGAQNIIQGIFGGKGGSNAKK